MKNRCLYCLDEIHDPLDFHESCSTQFFGTPESPKIEYTLDQLGELAKNVIDRRISVPGVQTKLSMSLVQNAVKKSNTRLTVVGMLGGQFLFKPPSDNFPEIPANEHLTMRMAKIYGIPVADSSLIRLASGELSYITKRLDRTLDGKEIHMLDMFQITEAFDKYRSSMEKVAKALDEYSSNKLLDIGYLYDLAIFSYLTGNNDMHLKNFSMIKNKSGWVLAPAYDLLNIGIVLPNDVEEFALTLLGKKRKLKREHFEKFGQNIGLNPKQISSTFRRFETNKSNAMDLIDISFLSSKMKKKYIDLMEERYNTLYHS